MQNEKCKIFNADESAPFRIAHLTFCILHLICSLVRDAVPYSCGDEYE
jgi:hypothetical protein